MKIRIWLIFLSSFIIFYSCISKKEDILIKVNSQVASFNCDDSSAVTYSRDIVPILRYNCYSCHNVGSSDGELYNYATLMKYITGTDEFKVRINHERGYRPMPQNEAKMSQCDLNKISKWMNDGALNN